jgi:hypothetical protein
MNNANRTEFACGSKESDPPFLFPQGESRGGDGSPHAAHANRQQKALAIIAAAAPPARGISKRSAEIPLARSPCSVSPRSQASTLQSGMQSKK